MLRLIIVAAFIAVFFLFGTVERFEVDYDEITKDTYKLYDKVIEDGQKNFVLQKEVIVDSIMKGGKKMEDIRPTGDYLPASNYPFYDGAAFFDSTPVHKVMTGIPSLYSGGDLKSKPNKYQPFEIANYNPGIARYSSDIPASANF